MGDIKMSFPVLGMSCAGCAVSVESMLRSATGVADAGVNFASQTAWVKYNARIVTPADLQDTVRSVGYDLVIDSVNTEKVVEVNHQKYYKELKHRTVWACILSFPIVVIGMFFMDLPFAKWISMLLCAPVVFYFGGNFFSSAYKKALHGQASMDTLVAMSTGIAFFFSLFNTLFPAFWHARNMHAPVYFESAAVVIAFISLGKILEERAKSHTSSAIKKLMGLQPKHVRILAGDQDKDILIEEVEVGNIVIVRPGERIPVDGIVLSGGSFINESMISGEAVPVEKIPGKMVYAGTINQKGAFQFKAEKIGSDTILAQIIKTVREAQESKAPVQKLADKITGIFVPVVIALAVITFLLWVTFGGKDGLTYGLINAITVLIIACPCALGLATPTAIMVGVGKGAENNILIRDAESLEIAHKVNAIVLDKTGTITEGKPSVSNLLWDIDEVEIPFHRQVLFSLESLSEHPLADAVVTKLYENSTKKIPVHNFESITGKGVIGEINNEIYYVGNEKLLADTGIKVSEKLKTNAGKLSREANTVIYFAGNEQVFAIIAIADKIKDTSFEAVRALQAKGIEMHMLTGDNEETAAAVAKAVGLKNFKANVLPSDKSTFIKKLQSEGKIVAMVGDGINDSEALALADISIAMGHGSDIAMDVAKITLITSDLNLIPKALNLSGNIVSGIKQNLFWAFIYNLIGIPLAAGILFPYNGFLLDPMIAGAAMALSSVSVVVNSLRLKIMKI